MPQYPDEGKRKYMEEYYSRPEVIARRKIWYVEYSHRPEVVARRRERERLRYHNIPLPARTKRNREWYQRKAKELHQKPEWKAKQSAKTKEKRRRLKHDVLSHYGNPVECHCCGERNEVFLTVGHVNEDGAEHKRRLGVKTSRELYVKLQRLQFPQNPPLRVECFNCNIGAWGNNGVCPHKDSV